MGRLVCNKCGKELEKGQVKFTYLEFGFSENLLRCPQCGQLFLDETLVKGRMAEVEGELEEK